jgi:predicted ester cyclase
VLAPRPGVELDLKWTILNRISSGDTVVEERIQGGTHRGPFMDVAPTGKRIRARGLTIYVIKDGRI